MSDETDERGPSSTDDLWRDVARMEAEVADPDEGETRHYQRTEMKRLIEEAKKNRIPSRPAMKAVSGGALGLPRRNVSSEKGDDGAKRKSSPPSSDEAPSSSKKEPIDEVSSPSSFDGGVPSAPGVEDDEEDEIPTQVAPREVMRAAARKRKAARAAKKAPAVAKAPPKPEPASASAPEDDEDPVDAPSTLDSVAPGSELEATGGQGGSSLGWVFWIVLGGVLAAAVYALRG